MGIIYKITNKINGKSYIGFTNMKENWDRGSRREDASKRSSKRWRNTNYKKEISKKISEVKLKNFKEGKYENTYKNALVKATASAAVVIRGTKWYNDGEKEYRLFPNDERIENLNVGRISNKHPNKKKRRNTTDTAD